MGTRAAAIVDGTLERGLAEVVALRNDTRGTFCTGALISSRVVLTAKHCVRNGENFAAAPPSEIQVLVGPERSAPSGVHDVEDVRVAPGEWNVPDFDFGDATDVAVLVLTRPAPGTPRIVSFDDPTALLDEPCTAVGYGRTPSGSTGMKRRTEVEVQRVTDGFVITGPAVCSGDSGGPLIGPGGRIWGVAAITFGGGCGSSAAFYNSVREFQELIAQALEDAGGCIPQEESCNRIDDDCDGEIDEGCTPIGAPCLADADCEGDVCRAIEGFGSICTSPCDPLEPLAGCPDGHYCARAEGCEGFCAPGAAGSLDIGEDCDADTECVSARCVDPGDGRRRCLAACLGDGGDCLAGEACAAAAGACASCVSEDLIAGERGLGETCTDDAMCGSDLCFDDNGVSYCSRTCDDDTACEEGFHCRIDRCVRGPRGELGDRCVADADCASTLCAADGERRWCSDACASDETCPDGSRCVRGSCTPEGALVGENCAEDAACASGLCDRNLGVCTRRCGANDACGAGLVCTRVEGGEASCLPPFRESAGGGCSVAGRAPLSVATLLLLMFVRRRLSRSC
ncbi:MAG: S1 family peptidase [Myxococcota bacterium]